MIFIISNSDGDTRVRQYTEDGFREMLNSGDFGSDPQFLSDIDNQPDTNHWSGRSLLIRGEVVTPKPKKTVTEWDL